MAIVANHALVAVTPDNPLYEINPSNWNASHTITGATAAQIVFGDAGGGLSQSTNLSWDDTAHSLTINSSVVDNDVSGNFRITAPSGSGVNAGKGFTFFAGSGGGTTGAGGTFVLQGGSGTGGNSVGGDVQLNAGSGHGSLTGGNIIENGGVGGATGGGGTWTVFSGNGGATSGDGGIANLNSGSGGGGGNGGDFFLSSGNATGVNKNGGNLQLYMGGKTGSGTRGYWGLFSNDGGSYGVALGTGVITRGVATGPSAITTAIWIPVQVDGVLTYIEGFR